MNVNYKKVIPIVLVVVLLVILAFVLQPHKNQSVYVMQNGVTANVPSREHYLTVTMDDIKNAGYMGITEQQPEGTDYQFPNSYFWVNNASESNKMSGDTLNLLMIAQYTDGTPYTADLFSYGTSTHLVNVTGAQAAQEAQLDNNRVALNFAKGDYYIVIIGPDAQDVESLANIVANKI